MYLKKAAETIFWWRLRRRWKLTGDSINRGKKQKGGETTSGGYASWKFHLSSFLIACALTLARPFFVVPSFLSRGKRRSEQIKSKSRRELFVLYKLPRWLAHGKTQFLNKNTWSHIYYLSVQHNLPHNFCFCFDFCGCGCIQNWRLCSWRVLNWGICLSRDIRKDMTVFKNRGEWFEHKKVNATRNWTSGF